MTTETTRPPRPTRLPCGCRSEGRRTVTKAVADTVAKTVAKPAAKAAKPARRAARRRQDRQGVTRRAKLSARPRPAARRSPPRRPRLKGMIS